jgi:hypothetical protein
LRPAGLVIGAGRGCSYWAGMLAHYIAPSSSADHQPSRSQEDSPPSIRFLHLFPRAPWSGKHCRWQFFPKLRTPQLNTLEKKNSALRSSTLLRARMSTSVRGNSPTVSGSSFNFNILERRQCAFWAQRACDCGASPKGTLAESMFWRVDFSAGVEHQPLMSPH